MIVAGPLDHNNPVHLVLQADTVLTPKALAELLSPSPAPNQVWTTLGLRYCQVAQVGSNAFRVSLKPSVYTAADYLAMSQPAVPNLDLLRKALERPCARMDGDYEWPIGRPVPNFVRLRDVAQILSQRAQCYLLLGQPEAAWHELALVRDSCHMLEGKPASNCPTLVEAMIDVAISGLYVQVIADGLRLQAWREPELAAMQKQLTGVNLLPLVREAMSAGRAGMCRTFEITPPAEYRQLFFLDTGQRGLWQKLTNPTFMFMRFAPRGWIYQNMCTLALIDQHATELFDLPNNQILPRKAEEMMKLLQTEFRHSTPYSFLGAIAVPSFLRVDQTLARTQTLANEAFIACGLERYRLAHGQYPETLEALVPQFAEKLPHDIIGGQPLKYRRAADGQFVLYSVGWNEKDDGGVPRDGTPEGDWVWP
jgi:hypothetical protein